MRTERDGPSDGPDDAYDLGAYEDDGEYEHAIGIEVTDYIDDPEDADLRHVIPLERAV